MAARRRGVAGGQLEPSALGAWALLLLSAVPFALLSQAGRAKLAIGLGSLLKRRLLAGALALEPEEIRHQGSGQLLGRVIESEAVETLALNGGFLTVAGLVDTALAAGVLTLGAGGAWQAALLGLWVLVTLGIAVRLLRARGRWTERRLDMTHDLVERLVGHRTRLAQEARERWHDAEDASLAASAGAALRFDRSKAALLSLAVGGTLAAWRGLSKSAEGFSHLSGALLSWRQAAGLFRASARTWAWAICWRGCPGVCTRSWGRRGGSFSHGERSRLYMARALLQNGDVVLLDESFAALDPASLHQALDGALRRVSTLVVIAHP